MWKRFNLFGEVSGFSVGIREREVGTGLFELIRIFWSSCFVVGDLFGMFWGYRREGWGAFKFRG